MYGNVNHFQGCNVNVHCTTGDQMNSGQTNGDQLNSSQSVGGNMNGDQSNRGQMNEGQTNGSQLNSSQTNLVGGMNAGPSLGGGTNGGPCLEGGTNAGPSTRAVTNAGQMIIARDLEIKHSENTRCLDLVNYPKDTRFTAVAELSGLKLFSIKARKNFVGLLAKTKYGAYLIFKTKEDSKCLGGIQQAIIDSGEIALLREVCLKPEPMVMPTHVEMPVERSDGWMELELGQFNCDEAIGNKYVVISIEDTNTDNKKTGLIVAGIEIRPIETAKNASMGAAI